MNRKKLAAILCGALALTTLLAVTARGDEIENEISKALAAYKSKEYSKAIKSLEFAAQRIRTEKAEEIGKIFPDPLPGWVAADAESTAIGSIFMGGAISASRLYRRGSSSVKIDIVSDSPLIGIVTSLLSTPVISAASPLIDITRIKGYDAVVEWKDNQQEGDIKLVVDNKVLITLAARNCQKKDLLAYANAVDYDKIRTLASR